MRDILGRTDIDLAYAVQLHLTRRRVESGRSVLGRKIGLTSAAVQRQVGVDRPDFGVLFDDMLVTDGALPPGRLLQPRVEAEIAFVLDRDLDADRIDVATARAAVAYATAALEVVDSRISNWDISITDTIADNASSGMFVLGAQRVPVTVFEPRDVTMSMTLDGREVSTGTGRDCLGDPLAALTWLANTVRDLGEPLRAGEVVLSGALGPLVALPAGAHVRATISTLGPVDLTS
ncbi:fumarylacetoacetate hydrolase family protein [Dactylosporangium sp. NPDC051485]|uniref:2-keto-4-pentenoate hydratase n=1 Tax=Dactylosporangium sp. NPDC051485 TaxID=3154846 RepID=UPI00342DDA9D